MQDPSLIEYPCEFPIKIMGHTRAGFAQSVLEVVHRHVPDFDGATMEMKTSKHGKYLSITCTVIATSREQLDALYRELCDHPMVVMVL
jgi:putative lipoic acid-binding regulatory protein